MLQDGYLYKKCKAPSSLQIEKSMGTGKDPLEI
jgi:hypothetical protein